MLKPSRLGGDMSFLRKTEAAPETEADRLEMAAATQTAEYIEDMLRQLERLAAGSELTRLAELLVSAREEARRNAFG